MVFDEGPLETSLEIESGEVSYCLLKQSKSSGNNTLFTVHSLHTKLTSVSKDSKKIAKMGLKENLLSHIY